jgi:hypothetical protein
MTVSRTAFVIPIRILSPSLSFAIPQNVICFGAPMKKGHEAAIPDKPGKEHMKHPTIIGIVVMICLVVVEGDRAMPEEPLEKMDGLLIEAAGRNEVTKVRRLLEQGASVIARGEQRYS